MSEEHLYSVLIVSASSTFNAASSALFPASSYWPVDLVKNASEARSKIGKTSYDIVVINTPLAEGDEAPLTATICSKTNSCVLLLAGKEQYETLYNEVSEYGAVVLAKPLSRPLFLQSLRLLRAMSIRIRNLTEKQQTVESKIKEISDVNRAKWLLIGYMKMTEDEAQKYIEKISMDTRLSKMEVAKNIIQVYQDYH